MRFASATGLLAPEFDPFADNVLREIVEAVMAAWSRMRRFTAEEIRKKWFAKGRKKKGSCPVEPHENWITDRLAGRIQNDPIFRSLPFDVEAQKRLLDIDGNEPGRIDLYFKHRHSGRDYFAFEAKRLHVSYPGGTRSAEYHVYTSDEGMEAYTQGQYSEGCPAAGMLAYVMDGETATAWQGLSASIQSRRQQLMLDQDGELITSPLIADTGPYRAGAFLGETIHRLTYRVLKLYHLVLPYGAEEGAVH